MSKLTRIGFAAALLAGSATLAFAQTPEAPDQASAARVSHSRAARHLPPRAERQYVVPAQRYGDSQAPWSSSFDPGMAGGGN